MEFNTLPTDLQFQIFDFLTPIEQQVLVAPICKRWHAIASEPILRTQIVFNNEEYTAQQVVQMMIQSSFLRYVKFVNFRDFNWVQHLTEFTTVECLVFTSCQLDRSRSSRIMTEFIRLFPNIRHIYFYCRVHRDIIHQIPNFKQIETVYVQSTRRFSGNKLVEFFSKNCKYLSSFHLILTSRITDKLLIRFLESKGPELTKLTISGLDRLPDCSYHFMENCPHLKSLTLPRAQNMTDVNLAKLQKLKYLEKLRLQLGENLFSEQFFDTFKDVTFSRLQILHIICCKNLNNAKLGFFIQCCPKLQQLDLHCMNSLANDDFEQIAGSCRELRELMLNKVDNITEDCLVCLARKMPRINFIFVASCPQIRNGNRIRMDITHGVSPSKFKIVVRVPRC